MEGDRPTFSAADRRFRAVSRSYFPGVQRKPDLEGSPLRRIRGPGTTRIVNRGGCHGIGGALEWESGPAQTSALFWAKVLAGALPRLELPGEQGRLTQGGG